MSEAGESSEVGELDDTVPPRPRGDRLAMAATRQRLEARMLGSAEPVRIGRYRVLRPLGAGGMGLVFAAYDNDLDRKVAVKLLRADRAVASGGRLRLEARALARVAHPNVVTVHEVDEHDGRLFVAMEHIDGQTVHEWLREEDVPWARVVAVFVDAARGLAAAHKQGVIHRDFKPDNVMVDREGRTVVMDFGLARAPDGGLSLDDADERTERDDDADPDDESAASPSSASLTRTGALLGTPAYMAPEQFLGLPADERSDQFSLCVSLWEALYRERPFGGESLDSLAEAVTTGPLVEPKSVRGVPRRIRAVLERGLRREPDARFGSMTELADALERAASRPRWPIALGLAALAGAAYWATGLSPAPQDPCTDADAALDESWGDAQRAEITRGFDGLTHAGAPATRDRVLAALDDYAREWTAGRRDACEASRVRQTQSQTVMLQRYRCLELRQRELEAVVRIMARPDEALLRYAVATVEGLPAVASCESETYVAAEVPPPEDSERAAQARALEDELVASGALTRAVRLEKAEEVIRALVVRAEDLGYRPTLVKALNRLAVLYNITGRAEDSLEAAYRAYPLTDDATRDEAALTHHLIGMGLLATGESEAALREHQKALAIRQKLPGETRTDRARSHTEIAKTQHVLERHELAIESYDRAIELYETQRGRDRVQLGNVISNRAMTLEVLGRRADAIEGQRRALEILTEGFGEMHPDVAMRRHNVGVLEFRYGDRNEAIEWFRKSRASLAGSMGPEHPFNVYPETTLALVLAARGEAGDVEQAEEHAGRAREVAAQVPKDAALGALADVAGIVVRTVGAPATAGELAKMKAHRETLVAHREPFFVELVDAWLGARSGTGTGAGAGSGPGGAAEE